jgi:hypothetical protein
VAWLNWWTAPVAIAVVLAVTTATYVRGRWRRAPVAFNAMKVVAGVFFLCGFLSGIWAFHLTTTPSESPIANTVTPSPPSSPPAAGLLATPSGYPTASVTSDSLSASEVGKAIAATYAAHSSDPSWTSAETVARTCDQGVLQSDSPPCRAAYMALHSSGSDLDRGPQASTVSLSEVADFCDNKVIDSGSALCLRAYAARKAEAK